jgi:hypothetical protein
MWPSEELAARLYNWANLGLIVSLVAGVISTMLLVWMGGVKEAYSKVTQQRFEMELSKQQERAANAEIELEKIRKRQEPRGVPVDLLMGILKSVHPPPPGKAIVEYSEGSPETSAFTNTLWTFVLGPLWNVPKPKGVPVPSSPSVPNLGNSEIALVMPDLDHPPAYGKALWQAFTAMGVRGLSGARDPKLSPNTVLILIGPKS